MKLMTLEENSEQAGETTLTFSVPSGTEKRVLRFVEDGKTVHVIQPVPASALAVGQTYEFDLELDYEQDEDTGVRSVIGERWLFRPVTLESGNG